MLSEKELAYILTEMFRRVGKEYSIGFTKQPDWFLSYSWSDIDQEDFMRWLTIYLKRKKNFTKEYARKQAGWFILHCGWKTETKND